MRRFSFARRRRDANSHAEALLMYAILGEFTAAWAAIPSRRKREPEYTVCHPNQGGVPMLRTCRWISLMILLPLALAAQTPAAELAPAAQTPAAELAPAAQTPAAELAPAAQTPAAELAPVGRFAGHWNFTGKVNTPAGSVQIHSNTYCHWAPSGAFLVCDQENEGPEGKTHDLAVYTWLPEEKLLVMFPVRRHNRDVGPLRITATGDDISYESSWQQTRYRTVNHFSSKRALTWYSEESSDEGKTWKRTGEGEGKRT
jgi:hypothetical protein